MVRPVQPSSPPVGPPPVASGGSSRRGWDAHVELCLVLLLIWVALGTYAWEDYELVVGDVVVQKTEIRELVAPEPTPEPAAHTPTPAPTTAQRQPTTTSSVANAVPVPELPPLDESPQRIMILGDSMVVNLIPPLADYCLENGHKLFPVIWYASTTIAWASQSKLNDVLREFDPTYVIIVLGASELGARNVKSRASSVRMINDRLGKRHFFWLGPPNWRKDTGFNDMVLNTVGSGRFFRSAEIELDRESDGIHPTKAAGRKWAGLIAKWMARDAAVRIPMREPTKKANPPSAKVYPPPYKVPADYHERHKKK